MMAAQPYMPASGTEGADFEVKWCRNCKRDENAECGDGCRLLADAFAGKGPKEWRLWRGEAVCDAFEPIEPGFYPQLAGSAVADLFPDSLRAPSWGAQIRMIMNPMRSLN